MSSIDLEPAGAPTPEPPEAARQAPASEVPLTQPQRSVLQVRSRPGKVIRHAAPVAIGVPVVLGHVLLKCARTAGRVPLIGWLLWIYGLVLAAAGALMAAFLAPFVFACAIPVLLLTRRAKLRADLAGGTATVRAGTYRVTDRKTSGTLDCGGVALGLSSRQMAGLRPVLQETDEGCSFTGAVTYAPNSRTVLLIADERGVALVEAG